MTRLNSDNLSKLPPIEPLSPDFRPAAINPAIEPFDLFLRRAGSAAEAAPIQRPPEPRQPAREREEDSRDPTRPQETEPNRSPPNAPESSESVDDQEPKRESSPVSESSGNVDPNAPRDSKSEAQAASPAAESDGQSDTKVEDEAQAPVASDADKEDEKETEDENEAVEVAVAVLTDSPADIQPAGPPDEVEQTASAEAESDGKENGQPKKKSAATVNSPKDDQAGRTGPIAEKSNEPVAASTPAQPSEASEVDSSIEEQDQAQPAGSAEDKPQPAESVQPSNGELGIVRSETERPNVPVGDDRAKGDADRSNSQRKPRGESRPQAARRVAAPATGPPSGDAAIAAPESLPSAAPAVEAVDLGAEPATPNLDSVASETSAPAAAETTAKTDSGGKNETESPLGRVASNETSRAAAAAGEKTSGADQSERVRFVQRVARAFQSIGDREGTIRLRLHPPELGSLELKITVRNGLLAARMEAETSTARALLLDNLPALRERLAGHDIKVDRFDVELMDRSLNDSPRGSDDQAPWRDDSGGGDRSSAGGRKNVTDDPRQARALAQFGEGSQLDVVV
jgi:flagellar hook-length control protein FliK